MPVVTAPDDMMVVRVTDRTEAVRLRDCYEKLAGGAIMLPVEGAYVVVWPSASESGECEPAPSSPK